MQIVNRVAPHAIYVGYAHFDKTSAFREGEKVIVYVDDITYVLPDLGEVIRPAKVVSFDKRCTVFLPYIYFTRQP